MSRGGVYVYRARKPAARLRIPLLSWHFCYVGETISFYHRHLQHVAGGGQFATEQKPWADLDPYVAFRIPLPPWKWLLHAVETIVILAVWPVYNDRKNHWNPRRVSLRDQRWQRGMRDATGWCLNWTWGHAFATCLVVSLILWTVTR